MLRSLLALSLLGECKRLGFVSFMLANLYWISVAALIHSPAIALGNVIFFAVNVRSYWRWQVA
jgi:hypothetical protein